MPIETECAGCGKRYSLPEKFAGRKAQCKNCGAEMRIPQLPAAAEPEMDFDALAAAENSGTVDESEPAPVTSATLPPPPRPAATGTIFGQHKTAAPVEQPMRLGVRIDRS